MSTMELKKGMVKCVNEPWGDNGLEGFVSGDVYEFQLMDKGKNGKPYYRIYIGSETYYETCGPRIFAQYFEEVT